MPSRWMYRTVRDGAVRLRHTTFYVIDADPKYPYKGQLDGQRFMFAKYQQYNHPGYHASMWGTEGLAKATHQCLTDEGLDQCYADHPQPNTVSDEIGTYSVWDYWALHPNELCCLANKLKDDHTAHRIRLLLTDMRKYPLQMKLAPWLARWLYVPDVEFFVNYPGYVGMNDHPCEGNR